MKKQRIYISGPMSGLPREEYLRRFAVADRILKDHGYKTINPCRVYVCRWPWLYKVVGYWLTLLYDLWLLTGRADAFVSLPGWDSSRGAQIERFVAQCQGIQDVPLNVREEVKEATGFQR